MSINLSDFNGFLEKSAGISAALALKKRGSSVEFFTPYYSTTDFFRRGFSIVVAPLCLSIFFAEAFLCVVWDGLSSINAFIKQNISDAKKNLAYSLISVRLVIALSVLIVISPLVNLIDFIGGGITHFKNSESPDSVSYS